MATDEVTVLFRGMIYSANIFPRSTNVFVSNYTNYTTGYTKVCTGLVHPIHGTVMCAV
jgi:hypothetical protein